MGSGFLKKKKQARLMQEQLGAMQQKLSSRLETIEVTGSAGNGLVEITLNGSNEMKKIKIRPDCVDPEDVEGLETLIKAAYDDASSKLKENSEESLGMVNGIPDMASLLNM
jgi:nucleoid-associated protein EbfC